LFLDSFLGSSHSLFSLLRNFGNPLNTSILHTHTTCKPPKTIYTQSMNNEPKREINLTPHNHHYIHMPGCLREMIPKRNVTEPVNPVLSYTNASFRSARHHHHHPLARRAEVHAEHLEKHTHCVGWLPVGDAKSSLEAVRGELAPRRTTTTTTSASRNVPRVRSGSLARSSYKRPAVAH